MIVPKGKTLYINHKKYNAGDEIPKSLEAKCEKIFNKSKPAKYEKESVKKQDSK